MEKRRKVTLVAVAILAVGIFFFLPFVPASEPGGIQLQCYFAGTCPEGMIHFSTSLSCYVSGDKTNGFFIGDSYSLQVTTNGSNLYFGCGGPLVD